MRNCIEIESIDAREVINARGYPTVEVEVVTDNGNMGKALVPSNQSFVISGMLEMIDNDVKRYHGKGVLNVIHNINTILSRELVGMNVLEQRKIDCYMNYIDDTKNKSSLGANAILGISMAIARAAANSLNIPLYMYIGGISGSVIPTPMISVLQGKKIKEIMIVPRNEKVFSEQLRMTIEIFHELEKNLVEKEFPVQFGHNGFLCLQLKNDNEALELVLQAIENMGYIDKCMLAINMGMGDSKRNGKYYFSEIEEEYTSEELILFYQEMVKKYPILSIEDGLGKEDWDGWKKLTDALGNTIHLVGNQLFTTNMDKLLKGIQSKTANSILIQPIQMGTVTETIDTIKFAKANGYLPIMSNSLLDTEDSFIADFAVALNMKYIKCGAPNAGENIAKYNQLLRIEEEIINDIV